MKKRIIIDETYIKSIRMYRDGYEICTISQILRIPVWKIFDNVQRNYAKILHYADKES